MSPIQSEESVLLERARTWSARAETLALDPTLTARDAEAALNHLAGLQASLAQARSRLCSPLRGKIGRVEAPYKSAEQILRQARASLSEAGLRTSNPTGEAQDDMFNLVPHGDESDPVIIDEAAPRSETPRRQELRPISASRGLLDLEALRPYLTEAALRQAIEAQLRATGKGTVSGVTYANLPAAAEMPCQIN